MSHDFKLNSFGSPSSFTPSSISECKNMSKSDKPRLTAYYAGGADTDVYVDSNISLVFTGDSELDTQYTVNMSGPYTQLVII